MSTANKLSYLNDTKSLLRTSLNKFGSNILTTDTFRSYDTKLNEIYDKLPKITATGQGLTISNVQNGLVDDFKMIGVDLEQDTTNGNQLVNFGSPATGNPLITLSFNNEILTLTGESGQYVGIQYDLYNVITNSNNAGKTIKFGYKSISNITGSGSIAQINIYYKDSTPTIYRSLINRQGSISGTYTIPNDTSNIRSAVLVLYTNNGSPASTGSVTIEEPLVYFDNNNTYEPYTGGIPSPNPDYPQEIKVVEGRQTITNSGKNLLKTRAVGNTYNGITASYDSKNQVYTFNGTCTADNTTFQIGDNYINFTSGLTTVSAYWISGSVTNYCIFRTFDSSYSWSTNVNLTDLSSNNPIISTTFISSLQPTYIAFPSGISVRFNNGSVADNFKIKIMVTDDENTDFEPYHEPVSYNIDLQLANIYLAKIPNTDYKNKIYKNNGNWYFEENVKKTVLDGSNSENWGTFKNSMILMDLWNNKPTIMCDYFKPTTNSGWVSDDDSYRGMCSSLNTAGQFRCMPLTNMTLEEFKTWLSTHNVIVWYELQNPVTTQITNTTLIDQLEAISVHTGTNIITISNSNNIIPEIEITRLKELEKLA